jgi:hypothetical protein
MRRKSIGDETVPQRLKPVIEEEDFIGTTEVVPVTKLPRIEFFRSL